MSIENYSNNKPADKPVTNFKEYVKKHPIKTAAIISAGVLIGAAVIAATVLTGGTLAIAGGAVFAACSVAAAGAMVGGDAKRSIHVGKAIDRIRSSSISSQGIRKQPGHSSPLVSPPQTPPMKNTNNHGAGGRGN